MHHALWLASDLEASRAKAETGEATRTIASAAIEIVQDCRELLGLPVGANLTDAVRGLVNASQVTAEHVDAAIATIEEIDEEEGARCAKAVDETDLKRIQERRDELDHASATLRLLRPIAASQRLASAAQGAATPPTPNAAKFKLGDIIRYTTGSTALMRVEHVSLNHGGIGWTMYHGKQCMGGSVGAYERDCAAATPTDLATWAKWAERHGETVQGTEQATTGADGEVKRG